MIKPTCSIHARGTVRSIVAMLLILLMILTTLTACAIAGNSSGSAPLSQSELRKLTFHSDALDKEMNMNVYLPKGYSDDKKYRVLYFLHGYTSNPDVELAAHRLVMLDEWIEQGEIEPLVIIAPNYNNSLAMNTAPKANFFPSAHPKEALYEGMYEDYLIKDVIGYVEENFSVENNREGRVIGGISMGGFSALHLSFKYPDLFSRVGAHSPAFLQSDKLDPIVQKWLYPTPEAKAQNEPVSLAAGADLKGLQIYIDSGKQDFVFEASEYLYTILNNHGASVQFHSENGDHNGEYWDGQFKNYMMFYSPKK
ncbi:esterase family protein [Paenibacillus oenotherae]|uniref:Esterase family protein n=1 Tax=Paenibacillus oenotherae TaxID=1435645 RepID=A0ABS7D6K4_9BACL|nr:alpha/beta hydrolase-fold protein [Paenibacillus oenotherae]MBW7475466.1 esterase family protein [Paenibacillus oenotherae]